MLQNKSYFSASFQGYSTLGAMYHFFLVEESSLAFRYDHISGKVILDDYDNRQPHTTTSFMFVITSVSNVMFLKDYETTQKNGHL